MTFERMPSYMFRHDNHVMEHIPLRGDNVGRLPVIGYCLEPEYQGDEPYGGVLFEQDGEEVWSHVTYWRLDEVLRALGRDGELEDLRRYLRKLSGGLYEQ